MGDQDNAAPKLFSDIIPAEYKDRGYLAEFAQKELTPENYGALFKKLDNAQQLVGRKGIPAHDAPEAEWEQFFGSLRPKTADEYEIAKNADGKDPDPAMAKELRALFHNVGLTKQQASKLQTQFDKVTQNVLKQQRDALAAQDAAFAELMNKTFGESAKASVDAAKGMLNEFTPDTLKPLVSKLPNESLAIMTAVLNGVRAKYMKEDNPGGGGGGSPSGVSYDELQAEGRKLMASPEFASTMHPGHAAVRARVDEIYKRLGSMPKK